MDRILVPIVTLLLGLYALATGAQLPDVVASQFGWSGQASKFTSRNGYLTLMTFLVTLVPLATWWISVRSVASGKVKSINLPHRDHWLAPPQREATLSFLRTYMACLSIGLAVFLAWVHTLVVQAHTAHAGGAARLDMSTFIPGTVAFIVATALSVIVLFVRFRRPR